jgi:hypothetical protein
VSEMQDATMPCFPSSEEKNRSISKCSSGISVEKCDRMNVRESGAIIRYLSIETRKRYASTNHAMCERQNKTFIGNIGAGTVTQRRTFVIRGNMFQPERNRNSLEGRATRAQLSHEKVQRS